jgi:hypothetical protein
MKKNILVSLLAASLFVFNVSCTSSATPTDDQQVENADIEKIESIDGGEEVTSTVDAPAETPTEPSLEASLNDPATDSTASTDATASTETTDVPPADAASTPTIDDKNLTDAPPPVTDAQLAPDPALESSTSSETSISTLTETPLVDTPTTESTTSITNYVEPTPVSKPAASVPMKKVLEVIPYQDKSGGWVNTLYIARPSEKLADISMKIFGADKSKDLKAISENRYLKSRSVRAGDKIYYVSPNRPDDSTRTISFYEDMGMIPETYVAKEGESLRKISKELLGYDNAWKEIWATNGVTSKTTLKDGETLRYWKAGAEMMTSTPPSPPPVAENSANVATQPPQTTATMSPPPEPMQLPSPPADSNASLPPPPTDAAAVPPPADSNASLPPPPTDAAAVPPPPVEDASASVPPPPPPPPVEEVPAVEAATDEAKGKDRLEAEAEEEEEGLNSDALMSMGALGVLVALLAFVIIRKKKQKSQINNLEMNA